MVVDKGVPGLHCLQSCVSSQQILSSEPLVDVRGGLSRLLTTTKSKLNTYLVCMPRLVFIMHHLAIFTLCQRNSGAQVLQFLLLQVHQNVFSWQTGREGLSQTPSAHVVAVLDQDHSRGSEMVRWRLSRQMPMASQNARQLMHMRHLAGCWVPTRV